MGKIDYHFFYPEPFDLREMNIATNGSIPDDIRVEAFGAWMHWYNKRAGLFIHDQYWQYDQKVYERFIREHNLPNDGGESIWSSEKFSELYEQARTDANLPYEYERYLDFAESVPKIALQNLYAQTAGEIAQETLQEILRGHGNRGHSYIHQITEAWFNTRISNPTSAIQELRKMPYPDYLKTEHWHKVRGLTVLVYRAKCCSRGCWLMDEGMWMAFASLRQVHHISYANRGNERFGDVCVLCERCHAKVHSGNKDLVDSNSLHIWY